MVVFVTGGAGFLGINLIRRLLADGHSVASYDIADFDYPEASQISCITTSYLSEKEQTADNENQKSVA